mgnify:CR=1 FL=1
MSVRVMWDNVEQTRLCYEFPPNWTWRMLDDAMMTCASMLSEVEGDINLIMNLCGSKGLPGGSALNIRNALARTPRRVAFIAVVTTNPVVKSTFTLLAQIQPQMGERLLTVDTMDVARAVLAHPYTLRNSVSPANLENN